MFQAFSLQGSVSCVNVTIIGDTEYEPDESFSVILTPDNPLDMISGPTSVTIVILNDDQGELWLGSHHDAIAQAVPVGVVLPSVQY